MAGSAAVSAADTAGVNSQVVYAAFVYKRALPTRLLLGVLCRWRRFARNVTDTPNFAIITERPVIVDPASPSQKLSIFASVYLGFANCYATAPRCTLLKQEALTGRGAFVPMVRYSLPPEEPITHEMKIAVVVPKYYIWQRTARRLVILMTCQFYSALVALALDSLVCRLVTVGKVMALARANPGDNRHSVLLMRFVVWLACFATMGFIVFVGLTPPQHASLSTKPIEEKTVAALRHISGTLRDRNRVDERWNARLWEEWHVPLWRREAVSHNVFAEDTDRVSRAARLWLSLGNLMAAAVPMSSWFHRYWRQHYVHPSDKDSAAAALREDAGDFKTALHPHEQDSTARMLAADIEDLVEEGPCGEQLKAVLDSVGHDTFRQPYDPFRATRVQQTLRFVYASALRIVAHDWGFYFLADEFKAQQFDAANALLEVTGLVSAARDAAIPATAMTPSACKGLYESIGLIHEARRALLTKVGVTCDADDLLRSAGMEPAVTEELLGSAGFITADARRALLEQMGLSLETYKENVAAKVADPAVRDVLLQLVSLTPETRRTVLARHGLARNAGELLREAGLNGDQIAALVASTETDPAKIAQRPTTYPKSRQEKMAETAGDIINACFAVNRRCVLLDPVLELLQCVRATAESPNDPVAWKSAVVPSIMAFATNVLLHDREVGTVEAIEGVSGSETCAAYVVTHNGSGGSSPCADVVFVVGPRVEATPTCSPQLYSVRPSTHDWMCDPDIAAIHEHCRQRFRHVTFHVFGTDDSGGEAVLAAAALHHVPNPSKWTWLAGQGRGGRRIDVVSAAPGREHAQPVALYTLDAPAVLTNEGAATMRGRAGIRHLRFTTHPGTLEGRWHEFRARFPRWRPASNVNGNTTELLQQREADSTVGRAFAATFAPVVDGVSEAPIAAPFAQLFHRVSAVAVAPEGNSKAFHFGARVRVSEDASGALKPLPERSVAAALCGSDLVTSQQRDAWRLRYLQPAPTPAQYAAVISQQLWRWLQDPLSFRKLELS